jgi:hypothetical protein
MPETEQRNINPAALPDFHTSSGDNVLYCPLPSVRVRSRRFPHVGGCYLLKYNGGDSGMMISVLYRRCSLIRVSVIRGSSVFWQTPTPNVTTVNVSIKRLFLTQIHVAGLLGWVISSPPRPLHNITQHINNTNIHTQSGIRTRDLSSQNLRLRPHGHRDCHKQDLHCVLK